MGKMDPLEDALSEIVTPLKGTLPLSREQVIDWLKELSPGADILILTLQDKEGELHGQYHRNVCGYNDLVLIRHYLKTAYSAITDNKALKACQDTLDQISRFGF